MKISSSLAVAALVFFHSAYGACPSDEAVTRYVAEFQSVSASKGFGKEISLADAECARAKLIAALPKALGERVGYKAVFTNPESQRRFGVAGPAWGAMFRGMMLENGAHLPAGFGARARYESDFVVEVKDAGLADAATPLEALAHISNLIPFVELPDLMLEWTPSGAELIATNAAFRGGILGTKIRVEANRAPELLEMLATMEVIVTEERSGREVGRARGDVLMAQPINAALWLARALKQDGITLRPGDLLSLGGFLASAPVQAGTTMKIRYQGLPGNPEVSVHFD